ncbi:MAG: glycosyltransferase [Candidatus Binataceae bacterium]
MKPRHLLLTCPSFAEKTGTELYVAEVAGYFAARGWKVSILTSNPGQLAMDFVSRGVNVCNDVEKLDYPDIIHGNAYFESLVACLKFRHAPLLFVAHNAQWWPQYAPKVPNLQKLVTVDYACRTALILEAGFAPDQLEVLFNFVDTEKFLARPRLPGRPAKALIFSSYAKEDGYIPPVREACRRMGLSLDVAGYGAGRPCDEPENLLINYDVVFAIGRCAIEAMAVGCTVILCGQAGIGPLVNSRNVKDLRIWNFGWKTLTHRHNPEYICRLVGEYSTDDAEQMRDYIRQNAAMKPAIGALERHYDKILSDVQAAGQESLYSWHDLARQLDGYLKTERGYVGKYNSLGCTTYLTGFLLKQEVARLLADRGRNKAAFRGSRAKKRIKSLGAWLKKPYNLVRSRGRTNNG